MITLSFLVLKSFRAFVNQRISLIKKKEKYMNEHAMLHIPDSQYCFPLDSGQLVVRLRMMRGEQADSVSVLYGCKYDFAAQRKTVRMALSYSDRLFDYYEASLCLTDVRLAYVFRIRTKDGEYYYSEDGLTVSYHFELGFYNFFQMPYIHEADTIRAIDWMREAVFYQIFVDRFRRGDYSKDGGYINLEWGSIPGAGSFAGGDLKGIMEKLDYIKGLGVNTIYLTPLFKAVSNHKYDISDYYSIDPQFGSNAEFKELVEAAHEKGIRIVLDAVFNHCSSLLPQFQDVLSEGKNSEYYDWFHIRGEQPDEKACNYECFASCEYMPKLNTANREVSEFLLEIARHWIREYDIDGWRLDVSDEISHDFWRKFRKAVKEEKEDCVIIGENWHDANSFLRGDQYDSIMNYAFTKASLDYFAFDAFTPGEFAAQLNGLLMRNKKPVNEMMLNLLDSHDTHRFYTEVKGDKNKVLAALAIEFCFLGAPCIYYGTEIGMEGGYDPDSRRTFDWKESNWDKEFLDTFRKITGLKKETALKEGGIAIDAPGGIFRIVRNTEEESVILLYNGNQRYVQLGGGEVLMPEKPQMAVSNLFDGNTLAPGGFVVWKGRGYGGKECV